MKNEKSETFNEYLIRTTTLSDYSNGVKLAGSEKSFLDAKIKEYKENSETKSNNVLNNILLLIEKNYGTSAVEQVSLILEITKNTSNGEIIFKYEDDHTGNEKVLLNSIFNLIKSKKDDDNPVFAYIDPWCGAVFFTVIGDNVMTYRPGSRKWQEALSGESVDFIIEKFKKLAKKGFYKVK